MHIVYEYCICHFSNKFTPNIRRKTSQHFIVCIDCRQSNTEEINATYLLDWRQPDQQLGPIVKCRQSYWPVYLL